MSIMQREKRDMPSPLSVAASAGGQPPSSRSPSPEHYSTYLLRSLPAPAASSIALTCRDLCGHRSARPTTSDARRAMDTPPPSTAVLEMAQTRPLLQVRPLTTYGDRCY